MNKYRRSIVVLLLNFIVCYYFIYFQTGWEQRLFLV